MAQAAAYIDAVDERGITTLHRAAEAGDRQRAEQLLQAGANPEARTKEKGQTPLHLAAAAGHAELVPLLINPTTLNAHDRAGRTALELAVWNSKLEAVRALVAAGAALGGAQFAISPLGMAFTTMQSRGCDGQLPALMLQAALADPGSAALVQEAVGWRAAGCGSSLLHLAVAQGSQALVFQLVKAGVDRDAVNTYGATPLWEAAGGGYAQLVPLLATPSNINLANPVSPHIWTPLYVAARMDDGPVVEALLAAGASGVMPGPDAVPFSSPLLVAAERGHTHVLALLLKALAKEHAEQQQQEQQKREGQHQQQQLRQGQPKLAALVADVLLHASGEWPLSTYQSWPQLLGVVLDVLGPGVAGEVCTEVQHREWSGDGKPELSRLADALLLGWLGVEEQLQAARKPLVTRLQRLVPGAGGTEQQNMVPTCHHHQQQQQHGARPQLSKARLERQLTQLVAEAALAAAAGQQQEALQLLGEVAALYLQQGPQVSGQTRKRCGLGPDQHPLTSVVQRGLYWAACGHACDPLKWRPGWLKGCVLLVPLHHPPGVYTTFLAAWVGARRQLQQLPQEVAATVVAAVTVAMEREQQQQQQQQGSGVGEASHEEERLSSQLSGLLLREAGGAAFAPTSG
jgi:ankyrin repeat protein